MALSLVTAPTDEVVTLAEARAHLHMWDASDTSEDAYIQSLIDAAVSNLDGIEGWLGRCIREQTLKLTIDEFPCRGSNPYPQPIKLPLAPLSSVSEIAYTDSDGTEATISSFRTFNVGTFETGYVMPAFSADWPTTAVDPGAVRVTYVAGYADGEVPRGIKHAILLLVGHWFEHREAALDTGAKFGLIEIPVGVDRLLNPYRLYS